MATANTATIVQPRTNYKIHDDGKSMSLNIDMPNTLRGGVGTLPMLLLFLVALGSAFFWLMSSVAKFPNAGIFPLAFFVSIGAMFMIYQWMAKPKVVPVSIDSEKLTVGEHAYLLDHIVTFGYRASGGYSVIGGVGKQISAASAHATSGVIYMVYGSDEIRIASGLHPDKIEHIYFELMDLLKRVGRDYSH